MKEYPSLYIYTSHHCQAWNSLAKEVEAFKKEYLRHYIAIYTVFSNIESSDYCVLSNDLWIDRLCEKFQMVEASSNNYSILSIVNNEQILLFGESELYKLLLWTPQI